MSAAAFLPRCQPALRLLGEQYSLTKKVEASSAVHLPLDHFAAVLLDELSVAASAYLDTVRRDQPRWRAIRRKRHLASS